MLERYGYPEQSLRQALISIESYVACLDIQRKREENTRILYVMYHYHCGLILWKFWKVSLINTEVVDISSKGMKTVLRRDEEFWREGGAANSNQILCRARYHSHVLKLNECTRPVSRTLVYPSHKKITEIVLYESERRVMDGCWFSRKKWTSATFKPLRKGARQTVTEITFHFDTGVETITKFKMQKKRKFIHEKWVARHEKCVRLSAE